MNLPRLLPRRLSLAKLRERWPQLHQGDAEPWPEEEAVQRAWLLFHQGQYQEAVEQGLAAQGAGLHVANKAQCFMAKHLEAQEKKRMALFQEVADRAASQLGATAALPTIALAQAHFWRGYALAQYSQGLNVAKALAMGVSVQVKAHLEQAITLAPHHAEAHVALAAFHADVIDKVGPLIGQLSYGVSTQAGLQLLDRAASLQAHSVMALIESARAVAILLGPSGWARATELYEQAARSRPMDEAERLEIQLAKAELQD